MFIGNFSKFDAVDVYVPELGPFSFQAAVSKPGGKVNL
jgi:hypothetical protein